jgi:transketolase
VIDAYSVQHIDAETLLEAGRQTGGRFITVEDHYAAGGVGDAVAEAVASAGFTVQRLAVTEIPRSGGPEELLDRYGISAARIVAAVKSAR